MGNATANAFASYGDDEKVTEEAEPFRIETVRPQYIMRETVKDASGKGSILFLI